MSAGDNNSNVDPMALAEGTITFELDGTKVITTEGSAGMDGTSTYSIGNIWVDVNGTGIITRNLGLTVFAVEQIKPQSYELVWDDCFLNTSIPCGFFLYNTDEPEIPGWYQTQSSDTFVKIDFQELGVAPGEKVVGTFQARATNLGGAASDRHNITNGAFNLVIQEQNALGIKIYKF